MKVLVTGATGQQGRAVIDHLLSGEFGTHEVYGLAPDISSDPARELLERGVLVVEGDVGDFDRMVALLEGVEGVFCVTSSDDADTVRTQGITLADAAAETGVSHFVYSSVAGAERAPLPHFSTTFDVETHLREIDLPATIIRPALFVQQFEADIDELSAGSLSLPLSPETVLHLVDVNDVGRSAAAAFTDPERFVGETFELAGDALTVAEIAATFADVLGHPVELEPIDAETFREMRGDDVADAYEWYDDGGYDWELPDLSWYGLVPKSLRQYLVDTDVWQAASSPKDNLR